MNSVLSGDQLVHLQAKTNYELPSNGLKDFEPNNSWLEQKQIQSALDERKALLEGERVEKWNLLMEAEWIPEKQKAEVKRKNKHWEVFGHHSEGKDWLFPEEVLYLMEMNCLDCHFGEVSLSIQKGYSLLLCPGSGCSATEYRVYSHLSRAGYRVMRHLPNLTVTAYELQIRLDQHLDEKKTYNESISAEQEIPRPDLPPKKILDLSNNSEVTIKANCPSSSQLEEYNIQKNGVSIILPEKPPLKPSIEVIDLADSSSEESSDESSDSDIEIIQEIPVSRINNKVENVSTRGGKREECKDDDIVEVPVPEKEIIVTTIFSSDSEQEDDVNESDSDKSYDGNWKRRQPGKRKKRFVRPSSMTNLTFLAVEEFCSNTDMKIEKDVQNVRVSCENVESEAMDSSDSVEFISFQPQRVRPTLPVLKSRTEILDLMPTIANQKIMSIESPDLRLLPDTIRPSKQLYTYNTNSFRARLFSSFRSYRGRRNFHGPVSNNYNPFYNNNMFQSSHLTTRPSLLPNSPLTQMFGSDIQSVARGMIQFASVLLGNGVLPQNNPTNGHMPFSFQSNSQFNTPRYSSPGFSSRLMYDEPSRSFSTPTHTRFSDSPVPPLARNDNFQQPFQNSSLGSQEDIFRRSEREEYNRSTLFPKAGRREHNVNRASRSRRPFGRSYMARPGRVTPQREIRDVSHDVQTIDPAYVRPDVPLKVEESKPGIQTENFIPISSNNQKSTEVIDILDDDDNFVIKGVSSRFMKRRKKGTRSWLRGKKRRHLQQTDSESSADVIISLNSPTTSSPFSDMSTSNVSVKAETIQFEETTIKQEGVETNPVDNIKEEKVSETLQPGLQIDISHVKVEEVSVKIEGSVNVGEIKNEQCDEIVVKSEQDLNKDSKLEISIDSVSSLSLVKTEATVSSEQLLIKTEPSVVTKIVDSGIKTNQGIATDGIPSTSAEVLSTSDSAQIGTESIMNEDCNGMEVDDSSENELLKNVAIELDNRDLSNTNENMSSNLVGNLDSNEVETEELNNTSEIMDSSSEPKKGEDSGDKVKNWAEMKKHNVPLGRLRESSDEEKSSSDEEGDEIQPLIRPKHCKTIGTVLSALQIFSPFTLKEPEDVPKLKISFDMYLATDFRKAQRGLPQYRIVVFGGMEPMPSEAQLYELRTRYEDTVPMLQAVVMPNAVVYYNCSSVSLPVDDKSYKN